MLNPGELKEFSKISALNTWRAIVSDWMIIGLLFYVGIRYPSPLSYLVILLLMARQQLALGLLMHDAAHVRFFKSRAWNDYVCQFLCAGPLFFSLYSYKHSHLKHHTNPLAPDDPDITLIGGYPIDKKSFARKVFRDLFGVSYFKFIKYFLYRSHRRPNAAKSKNLTPRESRQQAPRVGRPGGISATRNKVKSAQDILSLRIIILSILVSNFALFGILWVVGHPSLYLLLWILPSMTFLQLYLRIRGIAEHAGYKSNPDQSLCSRTVVNPVQTFLWAPHCVNYHVEHHLYPSVPFFRLPKVHSILKARGSLPEANIYSGYGQVLRDLVK